MRPPQPLSRLLFRPSFRFSTSTRLSSTLGSSSLLTVRNIPATHIGHIRILSLNNPQSRNAISLQLLSELRTEIESVKEQVDNEATKGEVVGEGTRVLILASEVDEAFCAGADLKERKEMSKEKYVYILLPAMFLMQVLGTTAANNRFWTERMPS